MEQISFKKIKFKDIDSKLEVLDDFCNFYEWEVLTLENGLYMIYDLQTNEIIDNKIYWRDQLIDRVSSRALEYEINEHEFEEEDYILDKNIYNYYIQLLTIYMLYGNLENNKAWFLSLREPFKRFKIEKEEK